MRYCTATRRERIPAFRCGEGHFVLNSYPRCPACGGTLVPLTLASEARLLTHTVVRVNPGGTPFMLGIARLPSGATTLCIVHGRIRGGGRDRVILHKRDDRFYALGRGARLSADLA